MLVNGFGSIQFHGWYMGPRRHRATSVAVIAAGYFRPAASIPHKRLWEALLRGDDLR